MTTLTPFAVLTVCLGNICRSPMMERLLAQAARELAGDRVDELLLVHGAGTGGWHVGSPMDPAAARQLRARGADPAGFVARRLRRDDVESSDLIITATEEHRSYVVELVPDAAERTFVFGELERLLGRVDLAELPPYVPDPDAVYARGSALVAALHKARGDGPGFVGDDLDDPWGCGDARFSAVADRVDGLVRPLAGALLS